MRHRSDRDVGQPAPTRLAPPGRTRCLWAAMG